MIVNLTAVPYETEKKGDVKRMRKGGKIPAIMYGHKEKSRRICIEHRDFKKVLDVLKRETVTINLAVEGKEYLCLIKAIQHNPVTAELLHIDFQHIHKTEKIRASVPIHVVGEPPGVKEGGILDQHLHEVKVRCLPTDIPARIDVDISNLKLGQTIHLGAIQVPNVDFELSKETTVVSVLVPKVVVEVKPVEVVEEEKVEEGAPEAVKEGEVKEKEKEKSPEEKPRKEEKPKKC